MPNLRIFDEDGLVQTTLHGMTQDAYVVTEDRVNAFNNYSFEFQITLGLFFTSLGVALGNINDLKSIVFITSSILSIVFLLFLLWSWSKFNKVKKSLFVKADKVITENTLIISTAIYGTNKNSINITNKIVSLVLDNKLNFLISNAIAGDDPDPGTRKILEIRYQFRGEQFSKKFNENEQVVLP